VNWADPALLTQLPLFMAATLVLNATPGVDLLLTVTRSAQGGARAGAMAALGIAAGCAVHALAAAFGLAALLAWSAHAFTLLKWAGAAYLGWLGLGMLRAAWRGAPAQAAAPGRADRASAWADFRRGLLTNLLNPKVALFMLAFLPQFIPAGLAHKTPAFLLLGALFVAQGLIFLLAVVALTARLSRLSLLARSGRGLQGFSGLLFLVLAARLAGSRLGNA
jgi:threonine/homoserine/homoserine lactone efflux protein